MVPELDLETRLIVYRTLSSFGANKLPERAKERLKELGAYSFVERNYPVLKEAIGRTTGNGDTERALTETIGDLLDTDSGDDLDYPGLFRSASIHVADGRDDSAIKAKSVVVTMLRRVFIETYLERERPAKA